MRKPKQALSRLCLMDEKPILSEVGLGVNLITNCFKYGRIGKGHIIDGLSLTNPFNLLRYENLIPHSQGVLKSGDLTQAQIYCDVIRYER